MRNSRNYSLYHKVRGVPYSRNPKPISRSAGSSPSTTERVTVSGVGLRAGVSGEGNGSSSSNDEIAGPSRADVFGKDNGSSSVPNQEIAGQPRTGVSGEDNESSSSNDEIAGPSRAGVSGEDNGSSSFPNHETAGPSWAGVFGSMSPGNEFLDTGDDFNDQGNATDYDHEGDETDSNAEFGPDDFFEHSEEDSMFEEGEKLNPNLNITKNEVILMLMNIFMRHNLTNRAMEDLLRMLNIIFGRKSLPESFSSFLALCSSQDYHRHYVGDNCKLYQGENVAESCSNCCNTKKSFFISFDWESNLKRILAKHWELIVNHRQSSNEENDIKDIVDGKIIKNVTQQTRSNATDISLSFNTDGVAVFNSNTRKSLWPIIVTINELPPDLRFSRRNTIVAGLWLSREEPDLNVFLTPFLAQIQKLSENGVQLNEHTKCSVSTVCCCVDSVARCKIQQLKQYNGYEACSFCTHPGSLVETKQVRYKYLENVRPRTNIDVLKAMALSNQRGEPVNGFKGISPLVSIQDFDIVEGCPVDYLHCVLLGVCKLMAKLWVDGVGSDYYIRAHVAQIDNVLDSTYSFHESSRNARKFSDRNSWKGNEWQAWLLLYGPICLLNVLPQKFYDHFCTLSTTIKTMLCGPLNSQVIGECEAQLSQFVKQFEMFYGEQHMNYNVHLLLHLSNCVRNFGPLWAFSLFNFEDLNGVLKKFVKGPNSPILQVTMRCNLYHERFYSPMFELVQQKVVSFCKSLDSKPQISTIVGKCPIELLETIEHDYADNLFFIQNNFITGKYLFKPDRKWPNESERFRCDSTFSIVDDGHTIFGIIRQILTKNTNVFFVYIPIAINHINDCFASGTVASRRLKMVKINSSLKKCVRIKRDDTLYVCKVDFVPYKD
ncbi:uncharacterized protein LOC120420472 isoform X2 [Culex pipiens pallens]|uniref:uncharacterized protein LOC120420472 isoform X2 n=1 Tax=Culex pipiens pallens TaxID=42434 RepID=UPI0019543B6E|nr:uncharacterized protein LOC120420472 isoform X2 [Culex pipiens pallens]